MRSVPRSCSLWRLVLVGLFLHGSWAHTAENGSGPDPASALTDWFLWMDMPLSGELEAVRERIAVLASLEVASLAVSWDGANREALEMQLGLLHSAGLGPAAVTGKLDDWPPLLETGAWRPQVWLPLVDRRPGLHYQKVRSAGQALLGEVQRLRDAGLTVGVFTTGDGWARDAESLLDVVRWLDQYGKRGSVRGVFVISGEGMDEATRRTLENSGLPVALAIEVNGVGVRELSAYVQKRLQTGP